MNNVSKFKLLKKLKKVMSYFGISESHLFKKVDLFIKKQWFSEFYHPSSKSISITINGFNFSLPSRYIEHYIRQDYEPLTQKFFLESLSHGTIAMDIGAHIGYYSLIASIKVGISGKIHSVEPSPENLTFLRKNIELNDIKNVIVHPVAAGKKNRKRIFHLTESSDSNSFYCHPHAKTIQKIEITEIPLDEIVKGPVHVVKIDVEGAEFEVLEGMQRILSENQKLSLFLEWNPACMMKAGYDPLEMPKYLNNLGFHDIRVLDDKEKQVRNLNEVMKILRSGEIPQFWYVNLYARRGFK